MAEQRIVLDARYVTDHFPGIGRYVYNLARSLGELALPQRLLVLYNPSATNTRYDLSALSQYSKVELVATSATPFSLNEQWQIPLLVRQLRADLYHAPYYVRPYMVPCPSITTLYDAIPQLFPTEVSARARRLFGMLTRFAGCSSRQLITISASARSDLARLYHFDPAIVAVTPLAADQQFHPQPPEIVQQVREKYDLPPHYMFSLSSNKPHKNQPLLIEAFHVLQSHPDVPMLVVAGHWDARFRAAQELVARYGMERSVRFLPNVANKDLPALYAGAQLFVYPSRYEGFGLPPLEALSVGTPVICGNHSSLPEVVGNAALQVDVTRAASIADGMLNLLHNPAQRAERRARGFVQAARFSWRRTAEQTLRVYETCLH